MVVRFLGGGQFRQVCPALATWQMIMKDRWTGIPGRFVAAATTGRNRIRDSFLLVANY